ncbi:SU10 major capsid protein [Agrobacterium sp. rho-8.1]|nr:DUF5309 family protein [Agrobacterium sp. rho-8.1]
MATLKTTDLKNVREDLGDFISDISPKETPVLTSIGKTKATNTYHETLKDELAPANKDNARAESADAPEATNFGPQRIGNWTQIFSKQVSVSGTLEAVDKAGARSEKARQIAKAGLELKRDEEAAITSDNASVATGLKKLGGIGAWLTTNVNKGANGASTGFSNGIVAAPTAGTSRVLTEVMFKDMAQKVWEQGGDPTLVFAPGSLKAKISGFNGGATKFNAVEKETVYANVDIYVSDFGTHKIIPHRYMPSTSVYFLDKSLWNKAVLRGVTKYDLAKSGDSEKMELIEEITLESLNEAGNGVIRDVTA